MWTALGAVVILGYFGFVIRNLYQVTSPPICGQDSLHCAHSVLPKNTPYLTQVYISNFPAKNFHYEIDKKSNVTLLVPSLPSKSNKRSQNDADDDDNSWDNENNSEDQKNDSNSNGRIIQRLGSVITSMNSVHKCTGTKIIPARSNLEGESSSPIISVVKQEMSFVRRHLLHRNKDDCMVVFNAKLDNPLWRSNNTRVYLSVSATSLSGTNSQAILRPVTQLMSTMYFPDKKKRIHRRYLLDPLKEVSSKESNPHFNGKPYMAVPKRTKLGPIAIDTPLAVRELERTHRKHWIISTNNNNEYAPDIYINTLISPRDEFQPLPIDHSANSPQSKDVPSIQIEMDAFAWRKYSIETLMLHSISQMETTLGTSQYDSDSLKLLLAGESPLILLVTLCVSVLHMLFEYLALSSNWSYFQAATKDASISEKVSRRAILLDLIFEILILTWLWDDGEAKIVQVVLGCRVIFNIWRYNKLRAVHASSEKFGTAGDISQEDSKAKPVQLTMWRALSLKQLTAMRDMFTVDEFEKQSIWSLSILLVPILMGMAIYQLIFVPQKGWLSWIIKTGALASYVGGFVAMTPQLYKNFYFKSVEHLPWTTLTYQFLNTIIDDLFSFLIRMPNAHRLSVFRDDIVFVIYWIQKRQYRKGNDDKLMAKKNE